MHGAVALTAEQAEVVTEDVARDALHRVGRALGGHRPLCIVETGEQLDQTCALGKVDVQHARDGGVVDLRHRTSLADRTNDLQVR